MNKTLTTLIKINVIIAITLLYFTARDINYGIYLLSSSLILFAFIGIYHAVVGRPSIEVCDEERQTIIRKFHRRAIILDLISYMFLLLGGLALYTAETYKFELIGLIIILPGLILLFRRSCPFCGFAVIPGVKVCAWCHNELFLRKN